MHTADMQTNHIHFMQLALEQARLAGEKGEVPVGAILVDKDGKVLATGHNQTLSAIDPSAHAEMLALRQGALRIGNYRLLSTSLYATIEPCVMCMGALIHARVAHVIFGAADPRWGAAGSLYDFASDRRFNHHPQIIGGVCEEACRDLIQSFFKQKRH